MVALPMIYPAACASALWRASAAGDLDGALRGVRARDALLPHRSRRSTDFVGGRQDRAPRRGVIASPEVRSPLLPLDGSPPRRGTGRAVGDARRTHSTGRRRARDRRRSGNRPSDRARARGRRAARWRVCSGAGSGQTRSPRRSRRRAVERTPCACDVGEPGRSSRRPCGSVPSALGGLDTVVNNAGDQHSAARSRMPRRATSTPCSASTSAARCSSARRRRPADGERGAAASSTSPRGSGARRCPVFVAYSATKAAVLSLTRGAALELAPHGHHRQRRLPRQRLDRHLDECRRRRDDARTMQRPASLFEASVAGSRSRAASTSTEVARRRRLPRRRQRAQHHGRGASTCPAVCTEEESWKRPLEHRRRPSTLPGRSTVGEQRVSGCGDGRWPPRPTSLRRSSSWRSDRRRRSSPGRTATTASGRRLTGPYDLGPPGTARPRPRAPRGGRRCDVLRPRAACDLAGVTGEVEHRRRYELGLAAGRRAGRSRSPSRSSRGSRSLERRRRYDHRVLGRRTAASRPAPVSDWRPAT